MVRTQPSHCVLRKKLFALSSCCVICPGGLSYIFTFEWTENSTFRLSAGINAQLSVFRVRKQRHFLLYFLLYTLFDCEVEIERHELNCHVGRINFSEEERKERSEEKNISPSGREFQAVANKTIKAVREGWAEDVRIMFFFITSDTRQSGLCHLH